MSVSGEGKEFDPSWWSSWGRPAAVVFGAVLVVAAIAFVALVLAGVILD